eukprot:SAG11_NODE_1669_length_4489_cov_4.583371_3_plen_58_part_00
MESSPQINKLIHFVIQPIVPFLTRHATATETTSMHEIPKSVQHNATKTFIEENFPLR